MTNLAAELDAGAAASGGIGLPGQGAGRADDVDAETIQARRVMADAAVPHPRRDAGDTDRARCALHAVFRGLDHPAIRGWRWCLGCLLERAGRVHERAPQDTKDAGGLVRHPPVIFADRRLSATRFQCRRQAGSPRRRRACPRWRPSSAFLRQPIAMVQHGMDQMQKLMHQGPAGATAGPDGDGQFRRQRHGRCGAIGIDRHPRLPRARSSP